MVRDFHDSLEISFRLPAKRKKKWKGVLRYYMNFIYPSIYIIPVRVCVSPSRDGRSEESRACRKYFNSLVTKFRLETHTHTHGDLF